MKNTNREGAKPRWPIWLVIGLGVVIFALPISEQAKFALGAPLYALFLIVYYKFGYKKKSS